MILCSDSKFMTNPKSVLSKQSLSSIFLYLGSSCHDTIHIYITILYAIIISHPRDHHISIIPDIKDYIIKLLHLLFSKLPYQKQIFFIF